MIRNDDILKNVRVAAPCGQSWEAMEGDDRSRYCGACRLNVYNLSGMSLEEARKLIRSREGRLCVRFYQRRDGTVLTKDCPVGVRLARRKLANAIAFTLMILISGLGIAARALRGDKPSPPASWYGDSKNRIRQIEPVRTILNSIDPPAPMGKYAMGEFVEPAPPFISQREKRQ